VPFAKIGDAQRAARAAVDGALSSLAASSRGRPCTRFRTPAASMLEMEIGTIVAADLPGHGRGGAVGPAAGPGRPFPAEGVVRRHARRLADPVRLCKAEKLKLAGTNWKSTCLGKASIPPGSRPTLRAAGLIGAKSKRTLTAFCCHRGRA